MKVIKNYATYIVDDKTLIILSKNYKGSPMFYYTYDILIGPKNTIERYSKELFPEHLLKTGWMPTTRYL